MTPITAAAKEQEHFEQLRETTLSKLKKFLERPKQTTDVVREKKEYENAPKTALVLTPLFDLHGSFVPPTPNNTDVEVCSDPISFSLEQTEGMAHQNAVKDSVVIEEEAVSRAKHRILQHQVNTSILRDGVLMKLKNFLEDAS